MKKSRNEKIVERMINRETAERTRNGMLAMIALNGWIRY